MSKFIFATTVLFAAITVQPAVASQALALQAREYTVIINNTCHRDIRVAIHYRHPDNGWITEGWWEVAGNSELPTGIVSDHNRFFMHGDTPGRLQWPPERSRKQYNRYSVVEENFRIPETDSREAGVPFSLKEVPADSRGLKARFDC